MTEPQNCKIELTNEDEKNKILKLYRSNNNPIDEEENKERILTKFSELYEIICDPKKFIKTSDLKPGDERELKMSMLYYISKNITKKFGLLIDDMITLIESSPEKDTPGSFMNIISMQLSSFKENKLLQLDVRQLLEAVDQIIGYKKQIQTRIDINSAQGNSETKKKKEKREAEEEKIKRYFIGLNEKDYLESSSDNSELKMDVLNKTLQKIGKQAKISANSDREKESSSYELVNSKSSYIKIKSEMKLSKEKELDDKKLELDNKISQLNTKKRQLEKDKQSLESERSKLEKITKRTNVTEKVISSLKFSIKKLVTKKEKLEQEIQKLEQEIKKLEQEIKKLEENIEELEDELTDAINHVYIYIKLLKQFNSDTSQGSSFDSIVSNFNDDLKILKQSKGKIKETRKKKEKEEKEEKERKEKEEKKIIKEASEEREKIEKFYDEMINGTKKITDELEGLIKAAEAEKIENKKREDGSEEEINLTPEEKKEIKKKIISEKKEEEIEKIETKRDQDIKSIHSSVSDDRREDDGGRSDDERQDDRESEPEIDESGSKNAENSDNPVVSGEGKTNRDDTEGKGGGKFKKLTRKKRKNKTKKTKRKRKSKKNKKKSLRKTKKKKKSSRKTIKKKNKSYKKTKRNKKR